VEGKSETETEERGRKSAGDETNGIEGEGRIGRRGMNDLIVII